jgi:hypothetical protein
VDLACQTELNKCCGTGTVTAGTATFCISETGFGSGTTIKWNPKIKNKK